MAMELRTEAQLQTFVQETADKAGWIWMHLPQRTARVKGTSGFPDLVLAHPHRGVLFVELKTDKGVLRPKQILWQIALTKAGADYRLWRPSDREEIVRELSGEPRNSV